MSDLDRIREAARLQHIDWMHFHEIAMADPFRAEREAQAFCKRILAFLDGVTGLTREGDVVLSAEEARRLYAVVDASRPYHGHATGHTPNNGSCRVCDAIWTLDALGADR